MEGKYKYLLGKKIEQIVEEEDYFNFLTEDEIISIPKFEGYCACYVGEYIDEINVEGKCNGIITNIETNINDSYLQDSFEVYKGLVSFYFENGKINMKVHGEDNGYYGVSFTMPVIIQERVK